MQIKDFPEAESLSAVDLLLIQGADGGYYRVPWQLVLDSVGSTDGQTEPPTVSNAYRDAVLADNPLGYWRFEEPSGTIAANLGSAMSDGVYNAGITTEAPGLARSERALRCPGEPESPVTFTNTATGIPTVTLECLVSVTDPNNHGCLIKLGNQDRNGIGFGLGGTSFDNVGLNLIVLYEGVAWRVSSVSLTPGTHHVGAVIPDSGGAKIYLNGNLVAQLRSSSRYSADSIGSIGGYSSYSRYFTGVIDEVAIYAGELNAARFYAHYQASL